MNTVQVTAIAAAGVTAAALSVANTRAANNSTAPASIPIAPEGKIQREDAARFAKQATFGPTLELIDEIVAKGSTEAWLNDQLNMATSTYSDLAATPLPGDYCLVGGALDYKCNQINFSAVPVQTRFYANAINNKDQVRQRVAFALSQIIVASEVEVHNTVALATFNQIFLGNAFGNYWDILKAVTLNSFMGDYLDMVDSSKGLPNENYARELMQQFSIGVVLLNRDGTLQTDDTGAAIAAYSVNDVKEIARALSGWTYAKLVVGASSNDYFNRDHSQPMVPNPSRFDTGAKSFLGRTVPAGATQAANIDAVIDAIFNHPNIAPYICKRLIQQLTLPNPTPAYVARVVSTFENNGAGIRGDLKAIVRAIYMDPEARAVSQTPGKVKEPVLLVVALARAIGFETDGYAFTLRDPGMAQSPFRAPSVFNFYPYDFPLPQGQGIVSPASKLMTSATTAARHNLIYDWTIFGDLARPEFQPTVSALGTKVAWSSWEAAGADDAKTIDRINLVFLNGSMTSAQRQALGSAMAAIKNSDIKLQARKRAQTAMYIVASSPLFQVDR
jgi:uncharacterized protein (DUF1800 family)